MENSNIWIAVVVLGVMVVFFLIAYYTISKPKTNSIVVKAPQFYTPAVQNIKPTYVIDATYHTIERAPQVSGSIPARAGVSQESFSTPMNSSAPTTPLLPVENIPKIPLVASPSALTTPRKIPLVASPSAPTTPLLPVENIPKIPLVASPSAPTTPLLPVENDIPSGTKINPDVAALLLQKQNV